MKRILFVSLQMLLIACQLQAQNKPVKMLLLGCFHFDNPGLDVAKFEDADIVSPKRQAEVMEVVEKLAAFRPDKIFVEMPVEMQGKLDSSVTSYKNGKLTLKATEIHQLGYRLAARLNLPTLYAADNRSTDFPMDSLVKVLMSNKQMDMLQYIKQTIDSIETDFNTRLKTKTIQESLVNMNSPEVTDFQVSMYFNFLKAGDLKNNVGSYLTSEWWRRNMMIYGNIQKQLTGKEERILVIFGSGHTALLEAMMKYNKQIEIVPVKEVL